MNSKDLTVAALSSATTSRATALHHYRGLNYRGWDPRAIHNRNNLVQIPTQVHQRCVNSWMARKGVRSFGVNASSSQTMRQWVHAQGFSKQHQIGVNLLRHCGVRI